MVLKKSKSCKRKSCTQSKQRGGQASSCIAQPNLSKYLNSACYQANLHNTNPEAGDLSLAQGSGFLPGLAGGAQPTQHKLHGDAQPTQHKLHGGAQPTQHKLHGGAQPTQHKLHGDAQTKQEGGQCSSPSKPVTFDEYKASVKKYLGVLDQFGGKKHGRKLSKRSKTQKKKQAGGTYFSINPEEMIGGLPRVDKGDSCCHGAVLGGKFVQGDSGRAICGNQIGAGAKPAHPIHHGAGASKKTKKRSRKQRGGSEPASFPDAFANENGNFSPDASDKDFSCRQPFWGAKCR
jgi:hypothetical protein